MKNITELEKSLAYIFSLEEKIHNIQSEYEEKIKTLEQENSQLREQVRLLLRLRFERKTEKGLRLPQDQMQYFLFDEVEAFKDEPDSEPVKSEPLRNCNAAPKKCGRRPIAPDIPRVEVIIDIPEEEKLCACGVALTKIGEEVSEKLDIVPAKIQVIRTIRYKYACRSCEGTEDERPTVRCASMPPQLIKHGIVTPSLLTFLLVNKFVDALPLYRQSNMLRRWGVDIPRSTMSSWILKAADACAPLLERLVFYLRNGPAINMDETPVQVLREKGKENTTKSYMWVARGGVPGRYVVLFSYAPTRSGQEVSRILGDFTGFLQTDGYKGYEALGQRQGIIHVGCLAHVRRKFIDAAKVGNKNIAGTASRIVTLIGHIYRKEKALKADFTQARLTLEQFLDARKQEIGSLCDTLEALMKERLPKTPPASLLGKALSYGLSQWGRIRNYLACPHLTPDNNLAENALRPFVVGRKNWLFSGSPHGAAASALFYSLIESAKANGLNVQDYLWQTLEKLPYVKTDDELEALMPWASFADAHSD